MDEDTREYLHSIEYSKSPNKSAMPTFKKIVLVDKKNFQPWRDQMLEVLVSKKWERLIDGTLNDPDPNWESSEDEDVRKCYEIWKRSDTEVREWIIDSLDNTLKHIGEQTKTAKELWDKLMIHHGFIPAHVVGTLALLDSLYQKHISHFKDPTVNIDILMPDIENYDLWMAQMNIFLNLQEMTGFVYGSLRDPDPKKESQDKNVRLSSIKWKKLDKLVMKWIKDSLDDTLNEVVKQSKTSEDIWDELSTYFGNLAGLDSIEKLISHDKHVTWNINTQLPEKDRYIDWMDQMKNMLVSKKMTGLVDGSLRDPDPKGESQDGNVRLYSVKWEKFDTLVMEWMRDSLDDTLNELVKESKTSKDIWYLLRTHFDTREISSAELRGHVSFKLLDINIVHYNKWVSEMEPFLEAGRLSGYVNGALKDRGPKGELQDVWKYSEEPAWSKGADKQVMDFIMASLDDIPKNMVKEMKTAKELWDTLETFFCTDKTLLPDLGGMTIVGTIAKGKGIVFKEMNTASSSNPGTSNVGTVPIREELRPLDSNSLPKLKYETTYIKWKEETETFLVENKMGGFIDGTFRNPSEISLTIKQEYKYIVKEYSKRWTLLDHRVMTLIMSSLSDILRDIVKDLKSSKELWIALELLHTIGYPSNTPVIEASFLSIKLSGKKNYRQWAQQINGLLEVHGLQNLVHPLSRPPPATFKNHARWKESNQLLMGWIFSSLEQNVIDKTLTNIPTATGWWGEIKNRYDPPDAEKTDLDHPTPLHIDTQTQLDSLEAQFSAGYRLKKTSILDHKENYDSWMQQKKETLNSANMEGFVDGSLKDPDPKGESDNENVKIYSMKWEKLDTQVMEWIRDSLDDTLKEVVKESKTSKDIWYMLRNYFSTGKSFKILSTK